MAVVVAACVPVVAGAAGMTIGTKMIFDSPDVSLDSHFRYLSGLLCAVGVCFWANVPSIESHTRHIRFLTFLVVTGGLARLAGAFVVGIPSTPMRIALGMELVVTPLLCGWQGRMARWAGNPARGKQTSAICFILALVIGIMASY